MNTAVIDLDLPPPAAEWRRSGPFLAIAAFLHAALLFYPLKIAIGKLDIPPPATVIVKLVDAVTPPKPVPVQPTAAPTQQPATPQKNRERPHPTPRPILAMPAEAAASTPTFSVPAPVVAPPAPVAAVASAPVAAAASMTAARFDAAYLHNPRPNYPPMSRRLGEEGKVLLKVRVSSDGRALAVDLEKSSNFTRLDDAALDVVKRWRFVPAKRGDEAIEASVIVPLVFRLEE